MLRLSSVTRLLTLHTLSPPSALRTCDVLSVLTRRTPPTQYQTRRSVATVATETAEIQHSVLIHAPALKDIEDSEYDADLIPPGEVKLGITHRAAEVRFRLSSIPEPSFATSNLLPFRSWTPALMVGAATTGGLTAREQPRDSPEGGHRLWRVSWVSI